MSALIPVSVNGVTFDAHGEYTSAAVAQEFQNSLAAFANIFNLGLPGNLHETIIAKAHANDNNPLAIPDDQLAAAILAELQNDPTYYEQLLNALLGGEVTKNYKSVDPNNPPETVTVVGLLNLLSDGLLVTDDPVLRPGTHYLSLEMAGALQQLLRSLQAAGVVVEQSGGGLTVGSITAQQVASWKNLSASSDAVRRILAFAVDTSGNQNRTLQALVELIYVKTGNDLLADNLERLENALNTTKGSLEALNRLQALHNNLTADEKAKFSETYYHYPGFRPTAKPTSHGLTWKATETGEVNPPAPPLHDFVHGTPGAVPPQQGILAFADGFFLGIDPRLVNQLTESHRTEFMNLRNTLIQNIQKLSAITPDPDTANGSLLDRMRIVLGDINKAFSAVGVTSTMFNETYSFLDPSQVTAALTRWMLDSYLVENTDLNIPGLGSGEIQRNLNAAVSAGQSLNDTQKEDVRRYLFVFEEYYKSAAAILSKITQILERMAQAISR